MALSRLALRGSMATRVRYAGASAGWYLKVARSRMPSLPGRGPSPPPKADAPKKPERPVVPVAKEREKVQAAAPAATLGSLLESQRRRRDGSDGSDGDDSG